MKTARPICILMLVTAGILLPAWAATGPSEPKTKILEKPAPGGTLNVSNRTGHTVQVFSFSDAVVHKNQNGGILQASSVADGQNAAVPFTKCPFSILLLDSDYGWSVVINQPTTDVIFTADTGAFRNRH